MNERDFCHWFQGFAELTPNPPDARQWDQIRAHLALVFKKVTPPLGSPAIPPVTPAQKKASDDLQRMIDEYNDAKKREANPIPQWTPRDMWPVSDYFLDRCGTGSPIC